MDYNVVVARHEEDGAWLDALDASKLVVYEKGGGGRGGKAYAQVPLKNVGREGETFLRHIVAHYDDLPEYLVLLQGSPFDHFHAGVTAANLRAKIKELVASRPSAARTLFANDHIERFATYPGLLTSDYFTHFFDAPLPPHNAFAAGSQYIVPRHAVRARPREFYEALRGMLLRGNTTDARQAHDGPNALDASAISGWTLERMFLYLLSPELPLNVKG